MSKPKSQVVVITGSSSGNGRAAAIEFAKDGAKLVLAARGIEPLNQVAQECRMLGTEAIAIKTDVTSAEQVIALAHAAQEKFGRIDVWINNAGVGAVGRLTQTPIEAHTQVIQTNLLGAMNGAYAVLPYFKKQKSGVIINTNSSGAWIPLPYASAYSASKFGLRGFMEALRAELSDEPNIHVCEVFPAFVDTPGIQHAANFVGKKLKNPPGAGNPERVGKAMVALARHPHDRKPIMALTQIGRFGYFIFPKFTRWATARFLDSYFKRAEKTPVSNGNLFEAAKAHFSIRADQAH